MFLKPRGTSQPPLLSHLRCTGRLASCLLKTGFVESCGVCRETLSWACASHGSMHRRGIVVGRGASRDTLLTIIDLSA